MFWLPMQTGLIKKEMYWLKSLDFWRRDRPQGGFSALHFVWLLAQTADTRPHTGTEPHPEEERGRLSL